MIVATVRYMSPTDWRKMVLSPRHLSAAVIAYRELLGMTSSFDQRKLWHYEIAFEPAPNGQIHIVYAPRISIDTSRKSEQYPGATIRISSGIETHVFVDSKELKVRRAYVSK